YYVLHRDEPFDRFAAGFESAMLHRTIQHSILGWSINWLFSPLLWIRGGDNTDFAADLYEHSIFTNASGDPATFGDLLTPAPRRPFLMVNACDLAWGGQIAGV